MNIVILDSKKFSTQQELHNILKRELELPEYYGGNLDALWDCLKGWIDLPLTIEWVGYEKSEMDLGNYAQKVLDMFRDAEEELDGFKIKLK